MSKNLRTLFPDGGIRPDHVHLMRKKERKKQGKQEEKRKKKEKKEEKKKKMKKEITMQEIIHGAYLFSKISGSFIL